MNKVDCFDLDYDDFDIWSHCLKEIVTEKDDIPEIVIEGKIDVYSELYHDEILNLYNYEKIPCKKVVGIGKVDVYEVTEEGALKFFKQYENRNHLRVQGIKEIYKLSSAFAISPDIGMGYVIHGDISKCKDYMSDMINFAKNQKGD